MKKGGPVSQPQVKGPDAFFDDDLQERGCFLEILKIKFCPKIGPKRAFSPKKCCFPPKRTVLPQNTPFGVSSEKFMIFSLFNNKLTLCHPLPQPARTSKRKKISKQNLTTWTK